MVCLELGYKPDSNCYYNSGVLALEQSYKQNEEKKLQRALALFMELKMTLQREAVQATLS